MSERLDQCIRFLMYVLIFWMPYSAAVVETCVILSLLIWFFKRLIYSRPSNKKDISLGRGVTGLFLQFKPVSSRLNLPIGFFLGCCLISVILCDVPLHALKGFTTKTVEWFVIYFLVIEVFTEKKQVYLAMGVLIFTAIGTSVDSYIQYYWTHKDIFNGRVIEAGGRATGGFKAPSGLGGLFTIAIPVCLSFAGFKSKSKWFRLAVFIVVVLMLWSLFLSFSRGAILGILVSALFFMFALFYFCFRHKVKAYAVLTLTAFLIIIVAQMSLSANEKFGFISRGTSNYRFIVWEGTYNMIKVKPWFGHGLNTFMEKFQTYRRRKVQRYYRDIMYGLDHPTYSHNCYLQIWAEAGIFSLIAFLWILRNLFSESVRCFKEFYRQKNELFYPALGLLSGLLAFLTQSFFDTNFYSLQLSAYFWSMVGLQMAINRLKDNNEGMHYGKA